MRHEYYDFEDKEGQEIYEQAQIQSRWLLSLCWSLRYQPSVRPVFLAEKGVKSPNQSVSGFIRLSRSGSLSKVTSSSSRVRDRVSSLE